MFTLMVSSGCPANTKQTPPKPPAKKFFSGLMGCGCFDILQANNHTHEHTDRSVLRPFTHKHTRSSFTDAQPVRRWAGFQNNSLINCFISLYFFIFNSMSINSRSRSLFRSSCDLNGDWTLSSLKKEHVTLQRRVALNRPGGNSRAVKLTTKCKS